MANGMIDKAIQQLFKQSVKIVKLWQNASPESAFLPQKISVDLTPYNLILMIFKSYVSYEYKLSALFDKGDAAVICINSSGLGINRGGLFASNRIIESSDNTGIMVGKGVYLPTAGTSSTDRNDSLLPFEIYGIKILTGGGSKFITKLRSLFSFWGRRCAACL